MTFENDINIENAHFSKTKKAACMNIDNCKNIIIDKSSIETSSEETVILAEEIGHYEMGAFYLIESTYNTPIARSNRLYAEGRAISWAIKELLPFEALKLTIESGITEFHEIAEWFNVTYELVEKAFYLYEFESIKIS